MAPDTDPRKPIVRPVVRTPSARGVGRMEGSGLRKPARGGVGRFSARLYDPVTGQRIRRG